MALTGVYWKNTNTGT